MGKTRVYELAKELDLNSKELIKAIQKIGIPVANHMSTLNESDVERIRQHYTPPEEKKIIEKRIQPSIIRRRVRRVVAEPEEGEAPPQEIEVTEEAPAEEEAPSEPIGPVVTRRKKVRPKEEVPVEGKEEEKPVTPEEKEEELKEAAEEKAAEPKAIATEAAEEAVAAEEKVKPLPSAKKAVDGKKPAVKKKKLRSRDEPARIISRPKPPAALEEAEAERKKVIRPKKKWVVISDDAELKEKVGGKKGKLGAQPAVEGAKKFRRRERKIVPEKKLEEPKGKKTEITIPKAIKRKIKIAEFIAVGDLARKMGTKATEVIKKLWELGVMATINQAIDVDTAQLVSDEFGYEVEKITFEAESVLEREADDETKLRARPPVITIMGHVDHGKTKLLDAIRKTDVVASEAGGITQHIGAYHVKLRDGEIVFIDTPGHEAFTAMRARGSHVTDIVVLVVAASEGVKEQTIEAINHAKAAEVPIIVALNKIDLAEADPEKTKRELTEHGLVPEEWGGDVIFVEISAKERVNIDKLLEMILLQSEMLELRANADKMARGTIIETRLDKGQGPVATVLIQEGTLQVGDPFVSGQVFGKVRALLNDRGGKLKKAGPSQPVEVLGFSGVPEAGDQFIVVSDERKARLAVQHRHEQFRQKELANVSKVTLENLYDRIKEGAFKELKAIIKADVHGSSEAVRKSINDINTNGEIKVNIIHEAVGAINESDVMLASASNAIVIGFNVLPDPNAQSLAAAEQVDIRTYNIIYEAIDDIKKAMEGLLAPIQKEKMLGRAQVLQPFQVSKIGTIAGSKIVEGKISRGALARLIRNEEVIHEGKIASLKRFKDDVKEALTGYECGIKLENYDDVHIDDIIEAYEFEEVAQKLK